MAQNRGRSRRNGRSSTKLRATSKWFNKIDYVRSCWLSWGLQLKRLYITAPGISSHLSRKVIEKRKIPLRQQTLILSEFADLLSEHDPDVRLSQAQKRQKYRDRLLEDVFPTERDITPSHFEQDTNTSDHKYLQADSIDSLVFHYKEEKAVEVMIGNQKYVLPFVAVVLPIGNAHVSQQKLTFVMRDKEYYELPNSIHSYSEPVKNDPKAISGQRNGDVLRLDELKLSQGFATLFVKRAHYFDYLGTNWAMDHRPIGATETLRDIVHGSHGKLCNFQNDVLVNHLGVVCMVESADGYLVVQHRSKKVANRPGTLSSSVSGVLDEHNLIRAFSDGPYTLRDAATGLIHKANFELGINLEDELYFLGLFRELQRGGKPELYFYARSNCSLSEIQSFHKNRAKQDQQSLSISGLEFRSQLMLDTSRRVNRDQMDLRVTNALREINGLANMTLYAGVLLSAEHVQRNSFGKRVGRNTPG